CRWRRPQEEQEDFVWGVLYEMRPDDKQNLDRFEGLGPRMWRTPGYCCGERESDACARPLCDVDRSEYPAIRIGTRSRSLPVPISMAYGLNRSKNWGPRLPSLIRTWPGQMRMGPVNRALES